MDGQREEIKFTLIEIKVYENGEMSVNSSILGDTLAMCGILEMAKAICFQYKANQAKIVKPQGGILNFARRFKHNA